MYLNSYKAIYYIFDCNSWVIASVILIILYKTQKNQLFSHNESLYKPGYKEKLLVKFSNANLKNINIPLK